MPALARSGSMDDARWLELEQRGQNFALGLLKRRGGHVSGDDIDGIVTDSVMKALAEHPGNHGEASEAMRRHIRTAFRKATRLGSSEQTGRHCLIELATVRGFHSGRGARLRKLDSQDKRQLCQALERHESNIKEAIRSGGLWRSPEYERAIFGLLVASITGRAVASARDRAVVDALVRRRAENIKVPCERCAPASLWCICEHTLPRFDDRGKQIGGADMPAKGKRKDRYELRSKFGPSDVVFDADVPHANHNDSYLRRDAAGLLVSEALRKCGIHSSVRHLVRNERSIRLARDIEAVLSEFERGPCGDLRERAPAITQAAPGARRRAERRAALRPTGRTDL